MRSLFVILISTFYSHFLVKAQEIRTTDIDTKINSALMLSEKALYDGRIAEAHGLADIEKYRKEAGFGVKHEILLTIRQIRIERFEGILYLRTPDAHHHLQKLQLLKDSLDDITDKHVLGQYYRVLSQAYYSLSQTDAAAVYWERAILLFEEVGDYGALAEMRAGAISRMHVSLLSQGDTMAVYDLIPRYRDEIALSESHSPYALAYNTRHLAQIYLKLDLDYNEALRLFEISKNIREEIGFRIFLPASYASMGDANMKLGNDEEAIYWYDQSSVLASEIGFARYQSYPDLMIGDIYLKNDEKEKAEKCFIKAKGAAVANNYEMGILQADERLKKLSDTHD